MKGLNFIAFSLGITVLLFWGLILSPLLPSYIYIINGFLLVLSILIYIYLYFKKINKALRVIAIILIFIGFNFFIGVNNINCYPNSIILFKLVNFDICIWFIPMLSESLIGGFFYFSISIISIFLIEIGIRGKYSQSQVI